MQISYFLFTLFRINIHKYLFNIFTVLLTHRQYLFEFALEIGQSQEGKPGFLPLNIPEDSILHRVRG